MDRFHRLAETAAGQLGCFTTKQARELGIDRRMLVRRERSGEYRRLTPRVWVAASTPITDELCASAALLHLGDGAVLSHDSAAAYWRLPGFRLAPIHVTTPRRNRNEQRGDGLVIAGRKVMHHTTKVLPRHHSVDRGGLRVMTPTRTLFALSARVHAIRLERLIDRAWALKLTSGARLHAMFSELARRGRGRIATMRRLLGVRGEEYRAPESNLEARAQEILRLHRLGPFERQVVVGDDAGIIGRVDFLGTRLPVIVEIDSDVHHRSIVDEEADAVRDARLEAAGYIVVRVPEYEVWFDTPAMVERIREGERRASRARFGEHRAA